MFIEIKTLTTTKSNPNPNIPNYVKKDKLYLCSGQAPTGKALDPRVQEYYKSLYLKQEELSEVAGYPVTAFEAAIELDKIQKTKNKK